MDRVNLAEELKRNKSILIVIPTQEYSMAIMDLSLQLSNNYSRLAYISMNKMITPLKRSFEDNDIDVKKFFFIDAITKTAIPNPPSDPNVAFIPAPNDLTKLSIQITKVLQTFDPDCIIFDSLSTLLIYEDNTITSQFMHSLVNKINAFGIRAVFTCLNGDKEMQLVRDLSLVVDKVIGGPA
ncbi:hypothetical protein JW826_05155 [Candidatus Woesearchaeota archaeon]|nr:hypothetical protein [Candidatus Woesearchaeota archaeon]